MKTTPILKTFAVVVGIWAGLGACTEFTGTPPLSSGIPDPATFATVDGALGMYRSARHATILGLTSAAFDGGSLADEAYYNGDFLDFFPIDQWLRQERISIRNLASYQSLDPLYSNLQRARGANSQAIGALASHGEKIPSALRGELYALTAYIELALADLYCSGVPLSTLDYSGDFTYHEGSTTEQIYEHAIALLDTALLLATDSARIRTFARIGKGRALVALGRYTDADTTMNSVLDNARMSYDVVWRELQNSSEFGIISSIYVADRKGGNGYPYISGGDPRTVVAEAGRTRTFTLRYIPAKYMSLTPQPFVLASGVEARLIQAEAAINAGNANWLAILNNLRTTGTQTGGVWNAGIGGVAGLAPLSDPGSDTARISLLFRERAAWLFLTGHRQGDLRRLVRQYRRQQETVYPTGPFMNTILPYGSDVLIPVPPSEFVNPLFRGCYDYDA